MNLNSDWLVSLHGPNDECKIRMMNVKSHWTMAAHWAAVYLPPCKISLWLA